MFLEKTIAFKFTVFHSKNKFGLEVFHSLRPHFLPSSCSRPSHNDCANEDHEDLFEGDENGNFEGKGDEEGDEEGDEGSHVGKGDEGHEAESYEEGHHSERAACQVECLPRHV